MSIKVRATERGYYGDTIREEGDEFTIESKEAFSERWMEKSDGKKKPAEKKAPEGDADPETLSELGKKNDAEKKELQKKLDKAEDALKVSEAKKTDKKKTDSK